jgi:hypothetical protein
MTTGSASCSPLSSRLVLKQSQAGTAGRLDVILRSSAQRWPFTDRKLANCDSGWRLKFPQIGGTRRDFFGVFQGSFQPLSGFWPNLKQAEPDTY